VVTSSFLNGPGVKTLPIVIFARARLGLNPTVNAVATLSVVVVSIGVLTGSLWMARNERGAPKSRPPHIARACWRLERECTH